MVSPPACGVSAAPLGEFTGNSKRHLICPRSSIGPRGDLADAVVTSR